MTTWYKEAGDVWVAYTVRPDIWAAGSHCWSSAAPAGMRPTELADWSAMAYELQPDEANGAPGAAEALILAGQVVHGGAVRVGWVWTEIADPRTE